ncbi:L,D-transpeptidase family protein [Iocasia frigidifontis]|uniref:L,D-transpeptidase family protein n=2 Tax=Iocasia fonsfrigidae TaxID=2682810 RepID=A0A8A7KDY5_9FIRM|nr:L,D-transpeptidase family protein [Iocasia fonsfrigidae]
MKRKIILAGILVMLVVLSTFVYYRSGLSGDGEKKQAEEDRLAKTELENVEENINGYNLEDDLKMTLMAQKDKESEIMGISQEEKRKLLKNIKPASMNEVLEEYNTHLPEQINDARQYFKYNISFDYFLTTAEEGAEIRDNPTPDSTVLGKLDNLDKASLLQRVESENNIWYRIIFSDGEQVQEGYIPSTTGTPRVFRFKKMQESVSNLKQLLAQGELHFINNYKNRNGAPPQEGDIAVDEYGYRVYHSAPAYQQADTGSNYRYIPDGMLVRMLGESGDFYHVNVPTFGGNYYIPKKYIDPNVTLSQLKHVIVVDRDQQNQAAFEVVDDALNLVSYTLSTTGISGDFSFETSLGIYKAIEKKERFEYLKSGQQDVAGYAPYATRFSGGAYVHGVPVKYKEEGGKKLDPGTIEYLHTIGTFPRSSMCVRNFTSHAQFLYNWMNTQNGAVIVME